MRLTPLRSFLIIGVAVLLVGTAAHAQTNNLARTYTMVPKDGMSAQFEAALKAHAQWRMDNGDPWRWGVSTFETGPDVGAYGVRSSGHSWADFDAYDAGFGPRGAVHFQTTVVPLVKSVSSVITATDVANSKPNPAGVQLAFVTVTRFDLRPGREQDFQRLISEATKIIRDKLPGYWVFQSPVTGGGAGPWTSLVGLYPSWSDMAEGEPTFASIMIEAMGQEGFETWNTNVGQTYRGIESWTQRLRPDLSVNPAN